MTQATETDLKEIKDLINKLDSKVDRVYSQMNSKFEQVYSQMNSKFEQVNTEMNSKFEQVNHKLNDMKVEIATVKEGQNGLNQRIDDFSKRIDQINSDNSRVITGVITAMIITLIAGLIKWVAPSFIVS